MEIKLRKIEQKDNATIARIIRDVLKEHGVDKPGTVYTDPTTDDLFTLFMNDKSVYFILEVDGEIQGGCGIYPTAGLPIDCAELVKLYISKEIRGKGYGYKLLQTCFDEAKKMGFKQLYLESLPELNNAVSLYLNTGFVQLKEPMGESGHFACNLWMLKNLE